MLMHKIKDFNPQGKNYPRGQKRKKNS